jgi:hypothetical protein
VVRLGDGAVYVVTGWLMAVAWSSYGPVRGEKKEKKEKKKKEEKEDGGEKGRGWWQEMKAKYTQPEFWDINVQHI